MQDNSIKHNHEHEAHTYTSTNKTPVANTRGTAYIITKHRSTKHEARIQTNRPLCIYHAVHIYILVQRVEHSRKLLHTKLRLPLPHRRRRRIALLKGRCNSSRPRLGLHNSSTCSTRRHNNRLGHFFQIPRSLLLDRLFRCCCR